MDIPTGIPPINVPFRSQHLLLKFLQGHLESCAFSFARDWLPSECFSMKWNCPESLELHKFFPFLDEYGQKIRSRSFHQIVANVQKQKLLISGIRHAAVHRIWQDRGSLRQKIDAAIRFARYTGGDKPARIVLLLRDVLNSRLVELTCFSNQLKRRMLLQIAHCQSYPQQGNRRLKLLPEAVKRVSERHERYFNTELEQILRYRFGHN